MTESSLTQSLTDAERVAAITAQAEWLLPTPDAAAGTSLCLFTGRTQWDPSAQGWRLENIQTRRCADAETLARAAVDAANARLDVYWSPAAFGPAGGENGRNGFRIRKNVAALRCVFADFDIGPEKAAAGKGYATRAEALAAIASVCGAGQPLPGKPDLVNSGSGWHTYWPFDRDLTLAEWVICSTGLKALFRQLGILADESVTADAARVLRVPFTFNHKSHGAPLPVEPADWPEGDDIPEQGYDADDFIERMRPYAEAARAPSAPAQAANAPPLPTDPNDGFADLSAEDRAALGALQQEPAAVVLQERRTAHDTLYALDADGTRDLYRAAVFGMYGWGASVNDHQWFKEETRAWCQQSPKYVEAHFEREWKSAEDAEKAGRPDRIGPGTLIHLAREAAAAKRGTLPAPASGTPAALPALSDAHAPTEAISPGDLLHASAFAQQTAGRLLYLHAEDVWAGCGTDNVWRVHAQEEERHLAGGFALSYATESVRAAAAAPHDTRAKTVAKAAVALTQDVHKLEAMLKVARSLPQLSAKNLQVFDRDPYLAGMPGGQKINLRTREVTSITPQDRISRCQNGAYDPGATCPQFDAVLQHAVGDKKGVIDFLWQLIGVMLTGDNSAMLMVALVGAAGTGKSLVANAIAHLMGDYAVVVKPSVFMKQREEGGDKPRNDIVRLRGARFGQVNELPTTGTFDAGTIKRLVSNDKTSERDLGKGAVEFRNTAKFVVVANNLPAVKNEDEGGLWRRMVILEFHNAVSPEARNMHLAELLEGEAPGIRNRALRGLAEWLASGKKSLLPENWPPAVKQASAALREKNDLALQFCQDEVRRSEPMPDGRPGFIQGETSLTALVRAAQDYARRAYLSPQGITPRKLGTTLRKVFPGMNPRESNGGSYWPVYLPEARP